MNVFDISIPIDANMPVWPGDPSVILRQVSSIDRGDEANVSQIKMSVHTGTHIDAPKHFINNGKTIGQIPLEKLIGDVLVVSIDDAVEVISEEVLQNHPQRSSFYKTSKILFKTRNSAYWRASQTAFREDYVGIDSSGATFLAQLDLDLIGVDYLSIAPFNDTTEPHLILLAKEIVLLEGIDLSIVEPGIYQLFCLPLNILTSEGAPARAILVNKDS